MLVLTRRVGESVVIGKEKSVRIRVISVQGNQVKIGIEAPKLIPIHREEVLEQLTQSTETTEK